VVAAEAHAYQVRHHQTDKANHAAHRHRSANQQGAKQQQLQLGTLDVDPEVMRIFIPQLQQIQATRL
jgi:hypothetical protein